MNFENIMLSYSNQIETAARCMIHVYEMYRISKDVDTEKISGFGDWGKGNGGLGFFCCSVTNSCRPSLRFHGLQHSSLPCPSLSLRFCSNACLWSQWCHPTISSSVAPFFSCPQSFPASESSLMSQLFPSGGQTLELQHQSFQWIFKVDFL